MQKLVKNLVIGVTIFILAATMVFYSFGNGNLFQGYFQAYPGINTNSGDFSISLPSTAFYPNSLIPNTENKLLEFNLNTNSQISFAKSQTPNYNPSQNDNLFAITLSSSNDFSNIDSCQLYMINPSDNSQTLLDQIMTNSPDFITNNNTATLQFNFSKNGYSLPANSSVRFQFSCNLSKTINKQTLSATIKNNPQSQNPALIYTNSENKNTGYSSPISLNGPTLSF